MASKQSKVSTIKRKRPGAMGSSYDEEAYYQTNVTTLADGSVMRETYRTDAQGNNQVKIQEVTAGPPPGGGISEQILSTATDEERKELADPDSQLRKEIRHQTESVKQDLIDNNIDGATTDTVDKAGGGSGNTEDNSDDNDGGGDADTPTNPLTLTDVQQRLDYGAQDNLRYPTDLATTTQDFMKIMMVEYQPRGLGFQGGLGIPSRGNLETILSDTTAGGRNILKNIYLPIPNGIQDSNGVDWDADRIDVVQALGTDLVGKLIQAGDVTGTAGAAADAVTDNADGVKEAAAAKITESITGVNKLARETGAVLNNNLELLFKGPQLRDFSFTFNMSARNSAEGQVIMQIIRTLKQGMSAKKSDGFLFIKSPHTFFLGYYKGTELHPYINRFKECALTNLAVNYAPAQYSTYVDGVMTQYQVTMTFKELEPVFDDDYGNDYSNIGF